MLAPHVFNLLNENTVSIGNWGTIKAIRIFGRLADCESRLNKKLLSCLTSLLKKTLAASVKLECISTINDHFPETSKLNVHQFLDNVDENLQLVGASAVDRFSVPDTFNSNIEILINNLNGNSDPSILLIIEKTLLSRQIEKEALICNFALKTMNYLESNPNNITIQCGSLFVSYLVDIILHFQFKESRFPFFSGLIPKLLRQAFIFDGEHVRVKLLELLVKFSKTKEDEIISQLVRSLHLSEITYND